MGCKVSQMLKDTQIIKYDEEVDKKILFVGLDNAGKTTILQQLKQGEFQDTVPTVGLNVE